MDLVLFWSTDRIFTCEYHCLSWPSKLKPRAHMETNLKWQRKSADGLASFTRKRVRIGLRGSTGKPGANKHTKKPYFFPLFWGLFLLPGTTLSQWSHCLRIPKTICFGGCIWDDAGSMLLSLTSHSVLSEGFPTGESSRGVQSTCRWRVKRHPCRLGGCGSPLLVCPLPLWQEHKASKCV